MNRRSDEVEELLDHARECVHREEFSRALSHLRRASALAPLRQDIKEILAALLEEVSSGPDEPVVYSEVRRVEPEEASPRLAFEGAVSYHQDRPRRALQPQVDPDDDTAADEGDEEELAEPVAKQERWLPFFRQGHAEAEAEPPPAIQASREEAPVRFAKGRAPAGPGFLQGLMERFTSLTERQDDDEEPLIPAAPVVRRRPRVPTPPVATASPEREEVTSFSLFPDNTRPEKPAPRPSRASLESPVREAAPSIGLQLQEAFGELVFGRKTWAPLAIYGCIFVWICLSGSISYYQYFRTSKAASNSVASAEAVKAEESVLPEKEASKTSRADEEIVKLGQHYIVQKRFDDAITLLAPAAEKSDSLPAIKKQLAAAYDGKGTFLLENNKVKESAEMYKKATDTDSQNPDYKVRLGNAYFYCASMLGKDSAPDYYKKAVVTLKRAIEADKRNLAAYQRLASVYEQMEQVAQAKAAYGQIIKLAPRSTEAEEAGQRLKTLTAMAN